MDINGRKYIRHPVDIPIHLASDAVQGSEQVRDVGEGGLCITCAHQFNAGETVRITITTCDPEFDAQGIVCWCRQDSEHYLVGITFLERDIAFAVRMVEQVCHIENYRLQRELETGEKISSEQAAMEWIDKYASDFPSVM